MWTTSEIAIPSNPLDFIIGQDEAVSFARIAAKQRRNLLLVGPPGTGKSLIAQALAHLLPRPLQEVSVLHNPSTPEKPILEVRSQEQIASEAKTFHEGKIVSLTQVPFQVLERLGFKCKRCGLTSDVNASVCPDCGADKYKKETTLLDEFTFRFDAPIKLEKTVHTTIQKNGREERAAFERSDDGKIFLYDGEALAKIEKERQRKPRKILLSLERKTFVQATSASETELLGDVKHDPYGGHPKIGLQPFECIVPGAVHEAHEGVLFIDELSTLGRLQKFILTAMQDKQFPITGKNASSTGASVRVDSVPCDFILVGAINTAEVPSLLPALRSRITGNGYEVLLKATMPENKQNKEKLVQFIAQEIRKDGKIPHADKQAVEKIISEAKNRAKQIDDKNGYTLRLRELSGLVKLAGDLAVSEEANAIQAKHVEQALERSKTIEEQATEQYGSLWKTQASDYSTKKRKNSTDVV
ncbi:AAA family ATPase [Candidatus Micrarchaeota archaeon]|nr:AAA family ATPase [Candidatus Micrarchaeota archaeon]